MRAALALALVALLVLAGCGETAGEPEAVRCEPVGAELARSLGQGLGGELTGLTAVRSEDSFGGPAGIGEGAYFASGALGGTVLTWIVGAEALTTGGGIIIAADEATREVSQLGDLVRLDVIGVTAESDGYAEARECARGGER